jgi:hypothetical protein
MSVAGTAVCRICVFGSILPKYHEPHAAKAGVFAACAMTWPPTLLGAVRIK